MAKHDENKETFGIIEMKYPNCSKEVLSITSSNNVFDFTNIIGNYFYAKIDRNAFVPGVKVKTIVDDNMSRIKSIIEGTLTYIKEGDWHLDVGLVLKNDISIEIRIRKVKVYNFELLTNNKELIEVEKPMYLDHDTVENVMVTKNLDCLNHVGQPINVSYQGFRDFYNLMNGSKRLDV